MKEFFNKDIFSGRWTLTSIALVFVFVTVAVLGINFIKTGGNLASPVSSDLVSNASDATSGNAVPPNGQGGRVQRHGISPASENNNRVSTIPLSNPVFSRGNVSLQGVTTPCYSYIKPSANFL